MRKCLFWVLLVSLMLLLMQFASAEEKTFTVHFSGYIFPGDHSVDVRYDDSWFTQKATEYHHPLAQLSMGTAMAAFRQKTNPGEQTDSAVHIRKFFEMAGFTDIVSSDYDKSPSLYTISSCIASKEITEGDEPFTLIAVAVCGGNYEREWMSNFTVDNGVRHTGFSNAAELVENRVFGYIGRRKLNRQRIKIWVVGFSRAGAVANTVGADLYDSEIVAPEDLFVYTFATPNTTRKVDHEYPNIFNIIGTMDVVPKVPLSGWGYRRYGNDLYTPSRETDSDFETAFRRTDVVFRKLTGESFWTNVGVNMELYLFFEYLLYLIPTPEVYTEHIQSIAVNLIGDKSLNNIFHQGIRLLRDKDLVNDGNRHEAEELINAILRQAIDLVDEHGEINASWRTNATMAGNLAHEHCPEMYMSWMLSSDNPEEIYSDSHDYLRFVYQGNGNLAVVDRDSRECVLAVDENGKDCTESLSAEEKAALAAAGIEAGESRHFHSDIESGVRDLVIPMDRDYDLYSLFAEKGNSVGSVATLSSANHSHSSTVRLRMYESQGGVENIFMPESMREAKVFFELSDEEENDYRTIDNYDPTLIDWFQTVSGREISWQEVIFIVIILVTIFYLALHLFLSVASSHGGTFSAAGEKASNRLLAAGLISSVVLVAFYYLTGILFRKYDILIQLFWILASLVPACLAFMAFRKNRQSNRNLIMIGLCICVFSDILLQIDPQAQLAIMCIAQTFFAVGFAIDRKLGKVQIAFMAVSALLLFVVVWAIRPLLGTRMIQVLGIGILMILLSGLSMRQRFYVRCSALLLFVVDIFEITLLFFPYNRAVELLEYPFYVLALTLLAISVMRPSQFTPREKGKRKELPAEVN